MAKRLPSILPPLALTESLETTQIHSIAGKLKKNTGLITQRPFRSPHHTISEIALVGGGANPMPGEITLAHNGVLFCDELPEFSKHTLEVLRQPLEDRSITISRAKYTVTYPCSFMFVASMNPCPCGYYGDPHKECVCSSTELERYQHKISGPILDRIDLFILVERPSFNDMLCMDSDSMSSADMKQLVEQGRQMQLERFQDQPFKSNGALPHGAIRELCNIRDDCWGLLGDVYERFHFTGRSFDRLLKVSRTIADLDGSLYIENEHISEAMMYRHIPYHVSRIGVHDGATV